MQLVISLPVDGLTSMEAYLVCHSLTQLECREHNTVDNPTATYSANNTLTSDDLQSCSVRLKNLQRANTKNISDEIHTAQLLYDEARIG